MHSGKFQHANNIGYDPVRSEASCVISRFSTTSLFETLRMYWRFRTIERRAAEVAGLAATYFVFSGFRTFLTISIWKDDLAVMNFVEVGKVHVKAANSYFSRNISRGIAPDVWSAQFRLCGVSPHNLRWPGLNIDFQTTDSYVTELHDQLSIVR